MINAKVEVLLLKVTVINKDLGNMTPNTPISSLGQALLSLGPISVVSMLSNLGKEIRTFLSCMFKLHFNDFNSKGDNFRTKRNCIRGLMQAFLY
jgi:hypothetical protein